MKASCLALASLLSLVFGMSARGQEAEAAAVKAAPGTALRIGLARVNITPAEPVWLYGYAGKNRFRPFSGVLDEICAQALAVEDAVGEKAVLIRADLCVLRQREEALLAKRIMDRTGLARRQILLNWSHTHSGPMLGDSDVNRYPISAEDRRRTMVYTEQLADKLATVAAAALGDLKPAQLAYGVGAVDFVKSRRQYDAQGKYRTMGPNPNQPVDRSVPVLQIAAPDGTPRAVLFGCACHAVTLDGSSDRLSGDYPSFARQGIEQRLTGVQALFVAGCGADANPDPRGGAQQEEWTRRHGQRLAEEVCRILAGRPGRRQVGWDSVPTRSGQSPNLRQGTHDNVPRPDDGAGRLRPVRGPFRAELAWVDLPLQPPAAPERLKELAKGPFWESHNARRTLAALAAGEQLPTSYRAPLALWRFGSDLMLVAISGEVVSDYARVAAEALKGGPVWVAGYSNQVFGYLPSARIVREGGYEALGFPSGPIGLFSEKTEAVIAGALRELTQRAAAKR